MRSRAGGKPPKARPRKALTAKGRKASKAVTRRGSPPRAHAEVARLTRELKEAQEQQAATADLLKVISQSGYPAGSPVWARLAATASFGASTILG